LRGRPAPAQEANIVKFCVLASGSSGNSALLATAKTRILVDAGLSLRELTRRLALQEEHPERLSAIVVTHEHSDHVAALPTLARRLAIPIYLTRLTATAIDWKGCQPVLETFQSGTRFHIGDIEIDSFGIPHDAIDPVAFCFHAEGIKFGIATDLGYITESVKFHLRGAHVLLLESNHDLEMLKVGPYPWSVKQRVMSRVGHLSNDGMSDFLLRDFDSATGHLILGHLSEHNNHPEIVRIVAQAALAQRRLSTQVEIASQKQPGAPLRF
jgi:phosphoribosyl 1,2-cyclic phosphodiesterase